MNKPKTSLNLGLFSGFHDPRLDDDFCHAFWRRWSRWGDRPSLDIQVYPLSLEDLLLTTWKGLTPSQSSPQNPLKNEEAWIFIGFSAGVIRAAWAAQQVWDQGHKVLGLIAWDGWGVPLYHQNFALERFSHDTFTHRSSLLLGGQGRFLADPPVPHLDLWQYPDQVKGWYFPPQEPTMAMEMTAVEALVQTIQALSRPV